MKNFKWKTIINVKNQKEITVTIAVKVIPQKLSILKAKYYLASSNG